MGKSTTSTKMGSFFNLFPVFWNFHVWGMFSSSPRPARAVCDHPAVVYRDYGGILNYKENYLVCNVDFHNKKCINMIKTFFFGPGEIRSLVLAYFCKYLFLELIIKLGFVIPVLLTIKSFSVTVSIYMCVIAYMLKA